MKKLELDYDQINSYHVMGNKGMLGFPQTSANNNNQDSQQLEEIGTQSTTKNQHRTYYNKKPLSNLRQSVKKQTPFAIQQPIRESLKIQSMKQTYAHQQMIDNQTDDSLLKQSPPLNNNTNNNTNLNYNNNFTSNTINNNNLTTNNNFNSNLIQINGTSSSASKSKVVNKQRRYYSKHERTSFNNEGNPPNVSDLKLTLDKLSTKKPHFTNRETTSQSNNNNNNNYQSNGNHANSQRKNPTKMNNFLDKIEIPQTSTLESEDGKPSLDKDQFQTPSRPQNQVLSQTSKHQFANYSRFPVPTKQALQNTSIKKKQTLRFSLENDHLNKIRKEEEDYQTGQVSLSNKNKLQLSLQNNLYSNNNNNNNAPSNTNPTESGTEDNVLQKYITKIDRQPLEINIAQDNMMQFTQRNYESTRDTNSKQKFQIKSRNATNNSNNNGIDRILKLSMNSPQNKALRSISSQTKTSRNNQFNKYSFQNFSPKRSPYQQNLPDSPNLAKQNFVRQDVLMNKTNSKNLSVAPHAKHSHHLSGGRKVPDDFQSIPVNIGRYTDGPSKPFTYYLSQVEQSFKPPFQNDYYSSLYREHFVQTCQGVQYGMIAKLQDPDFLSKTKIVLGENKSISKKTIVFDLDETLIHCNDAQGHPSDVVLVIQFPTGERVKAGVNIRPYCHELLAELSEKFEIIVFTASHSCYANRVIDHLDPDRQLISHRFYREHCAMTQQGVFVKDLRIFTDRKLSEMVLIDNASYSFGFQVDNGIPIIPFYERKDDVQFKFLLPYLLDMLDEPDMRDYNRRRLKMSVYGDIQGPQTVYEKLFLSDEDSDNL